MISNISSTTLQSWRERPPSSYSIKVKILSQLQSSTLHSDGKYQSRRFSSGGYKWSMIIYPKGNDNDNGGGYLSMYVEIDSTSLMSTQPEVYADIRFFVFNKKENKYFTIQDVESKPFNTLRKIWGLPQVLPIDTFNDRKNGYIFYGECCEFGVDVIVAPPPTKWEIISFGDKFVVPKFSWTVKHFSQIKKNPHASSCSFSMGEKNWVLKIYPKGYSTPDSKWVSISLFLADGEVLEEDEKIYVQADLKVVNIRGSDLRGSNHLTKKLEFWFKKPGIGYGWHHYVSIDEVRKYYLDNDETLEVEIEFEVVSATHYASFT